MAPTDPALPAPGTIAHTAAHLARWGRLAPEGLARVEFTSEHSRQRVVDLLRAELSAAGVPFHEIVLPARVPAPQIVRDLVARFRDLAPGVVSLTGFATAFPEDRPRVDSLRVLNFNRENLALHPLRQIWWMTPDFAQDFLQSVPDLDSWFLVRLRLTENISAPAGPERTISSQFPQHVIPNEEAKPRSEYYEDRFRQALAQGATAQPLLELSLDAVEPLQEAGRVQEAQQLQDRLQQQMAQAGLPIGEFVQAPPATPAEAAQKAALLDRLADSYRGQGRYDEAEPLYRRALAIREETLGPQHPLAATSLNSLAELYQSQGRYDEAEPLYQRALAIWETMFGPQHPFVATELSSYALLLQKMGRYDEAAALQARAEAIRADSKGEPSE